LLSRSSEKDSLNLVVKNNSSGTNKSFLIASGKGGVGKTSLSVNLSVIASYLGLKTILFDGDIGMADAHALLGLRPQRSILDALKTKQKIEDIILTTHFGLKFISGGNGIQELSDLSESNLNLIEYHISKLKEQNEILVIDAPAGIGPVVRHLSSVTDILVIVVTPNPTSLLDSYGLIKVTCERHPDKQIQIISNMVKSKEEGDSVFNNLNNCAKKFLKKQLIYTGYIQNDNKFQTSTIEQKPLILTNRKSQVFNSLLNIAKNLFQKK